MKSAIIFLDIILTYDSIILNVLVWRSCRGDGPVKHVFRMVLGVRGSGARDYKLIISTILGRIDRYVMVTMEGGSAARSLNVFSTSGKN